MNDTPGLLHSLRRLRRIAVIAFAAGLAACSAVQDAPAPGKAVSENEAAGQCREQALTDTKSIPGMIFEQRRDAFFKACMASQGY